MGARLQSAIAQSIVSLALLACAEPALATVFICPPLESYALIFRGKVESVDAGKARFKVLVLYKGDLPGDSVEVAFGGGGTIIPDASFTKGATDTVFAFFAGEGGGKAGFYALGCPTAYRQSPLAIQPALDAYRIAIADARSAIERQPDSQEAWLALAQLQESQKDHLGAIRTFERLRQIAPSSGAYNTRQGNAYFAVGLYKEALAAYDRAIALDATDGHAMRGRAECLEKLRRLSQN